MKENMNPQYGREEMTIVGKMSKVEIIIIWGSGFIAGVVTAFLLDSLGLFIFRCSQAMGN